MILRAAQEVAGTELMAAIGMAKLSDREVMEALVPGSARSLR